MTHLAKRLFSNVGSLQDILENRQLIEALWGNWPTANSQEKKDPVISAVKTFVDSGDLSDWNSNPTLKKLGEPKLGRTALIGATGRPSPFDLIEFGAGLNIGDLLIIDPDVCGVDAWMRGDLDGLNDVSCVIFIAPDQALIPNWLGSFPATKIAIISDFDFFPHKWIELEGAFDIFLTLGWEELEAASELFKIPVSVFPSIFSLSSNTGASVRRIPKADIILSGSVDLVGPLGKRDLIGDLVQSRHRVFLQNGFLSDGDYADLLEEIRFSFVAIRHSDSCPSRAFQALSNGCVPILPAGNVAEDLLPSEARIAYSVSVGGKLDIDALDAVIDEFDDIEFHRSELLTVLKEHWRVSAVWDRFIRAMALIVKIHDQAKTEGLITDHGRGTVVNPLAPICGLSVVRRGYLPKGGNPDELNRFLLYKEHVHDQKISAAIDMLDEFRNVKFCSEHIARLYNSLGCDYAIAAASIAARIQINESLEAEDKYRDACGCFISATQAMPNSVEIWFNFIKTVSVFGNDDDLKFVLSVFPKTGALSIDGYLNLRQTALLPFDFYPELDNSFDDPVYSKYGTVPIKSIILLERIIWLIRWRVGPKAFASWAVDVPETWRRSVRYVRDGYGYRANEKLGKERRRSEIGKVTLDIDAFVSRQSFEYLTVGSAFTDFENSDRPLGIASPINLLDQRRGSVRLRPVVGQGLVHVGAPGYSWIRILDNDTDAVDHGHPTEGDVYSISEEGIFGHEGPAASDILLLFKPSMGQVSIQSVNYAACLAQEETIVICSADSFHHIAGLLDGREPKSDRISVYRNSSAELLGVCLSKALFFDLNGLDQSAPYSLVEELERLVRRVENAGYHIDEFVVSEDLVGFAHLAPWVKKLRLHYSGVNWSGDHSVSGTNIMVMNERQARHAGGRLFPSSGELRTFVKFGQWVNRGCFLELIDRTPTLLIEKSYGDRYVVSHNLFSGIKISGPGDVVGRIKEL